MTKHIIRHPSKRIVYLFDYHPPISISDERSDFQALIIEGASPTLPAEVEQRVTENWQSFVAEKPKAVDNPVAYILDYNKTQEGVKVRVHLAGFRYNQYFNRDDYEMRDATFADLGYCPLASWIMVTCESGKYVLFGNKVDFGANVISALGGFTGKEDIKQHQGGSREIDVNSHLERMLQREMGDISKAISVKESLGINFLPYVAPRGSDNIYCVSLDATREQVMKLMKASDQFNDKLIAIEATPDRLVRTLLETPRDPSTSCFGGIFSFIGSTYGMDELNRYLSIYNAGNKRVDIRVPDHPVHQNWYERISLTMKSLI